MGGALMADFLSQANTFTVRILEGELAGTDILLETRALPYRGVSYETEQRVKTTYYAGNPVATQQVMGPIEKNTMVTGMWKDIFLGNGTAAALRDTFNDICRAGLLIEVRWGAGILPDGSLVSTPIVRRGVIKRFKHTYDRPQDIAWEVEFEWRGRDEPTQPPLQGAGQGESDFSDAISLLDEVTSKIAAFLGDPINRLAGFQQSFLDDVDDFLNAVAAANGAFNAAAEALRFQGELSTAVIERVRGAVQGTMRAAVDLVGAFEEFKDWTTEVKDTALSLLGFKAQKMGVMRGLDDAQERMRTIDEDLAAREIPDVIAEVRVPADTDLRDLAQKFYGNADLWWVIANFNGIGTSSKVPALPSGVSDNPGRAIRIPRMTEGAQGRLAC
jgi:hypothetical protein